MIFSSLRTAIILICQTWASQSNVAYDVLAVCSHVAQNTSKIYFDGQGILKNKITKTIFNLCHLKICALIFIYYGNKLCVHTEFKGTLGEGEIWQTLIGCQ